MCCAGLACELPVLMVCIGWWKAWAQDGRACFLLLLPVPILLAFCINVALAVQRSGSSKRARRGRSTTPSSFEPTTEEVDSEEAALLEEESQQV